MLTSSGVSNCLVKPADMMVARAAFPTLASYGKSATAKAETLLFRRLDSSRSEGYRHLPLLVAAMSLPLVVRRLAIEISVCSRGPRLTTQKPQFGVSALVRDAESSVAVVASADTLRLPARRRHTTA